MKLKLFRLFFRERYVIGRLFVEDNINGDEYLCDTFEPPLESSHPCISPGTYRITLDVKSDSLFRKEAHQKKKSWFYRTLCDYKVPRLIDVPGRSGILIHTGNGYNNKGEIETKGCILVGYNLQVGAVLNSQDVFTNLYKLLLKDKDNLYIQITDLPTGKTSLKYYNVL